MNKTAKIIIDVLPLTKLPLSGTQSFSYLHDRELPPGTLVSIPLFRRKVTGVVTGHRPDFERLGNIELKRIDSVISENFLTEKQLTLAEFISDHYFSPLGLVMKSFVPKIVKERKVSDKKIIKDTPKKNITLTPEQSSAVTAITKNTGYQMPDTKYLLYGPAGSGKTEVYIHSILRLKKADPSLQFLILLPELTLTPQAIERYGEYFSSEETAVLHSRISKGRFYSDWQRIKSGKAKIIIGSRMAVFAPFKKLGLIVVDEEQDMSFKQWDMNPRYDARTVAKFLAEMHGCRSVFGSATPRVETYHFAKAGQYKLLELPPLKIPNASHRVPDTKIDLVDMKKERWNKQSYSPISEKLRSEIAYALKNGLQTLLFVSRQGMSAFSVCSACKTVLRCPKCERALVYDKLGIYRCLHCAHKSSIVPACEKCGGLHFENIGLGTQKIEREIRDIFPGARLERADSQTMKLAGSQEKLYANLKDKKTDILIGTQMISKGWDLPSLSLVGIIDADNLLSLPDFNTRERAFQNLLQAAGRTGRPGSVFPGQVVIQTYNPENFFFRSVASKDFETFFSKESADRKQLSLPPFGRLISLVFQDYDRRSAEKQAAAIFEKLESLDDPDLSVTEPHAAFVENVRGRHRQQILLKLRVGAVPPDLAMLLKNLKPGWTIDVDPISII